MTEFNRRVTDKCAWDIDQLITEEDDPKNRVFLIVLNNINKSLIANTETINKVSTRLEEHLTSFEEHTKEEDALLNKGRGAWKVAAWVISIIQFLGLFIWQQTSGEIKDIHSMLQKEQAQLSQLELRVTVVERSVNK